MSELIRQRLLDFLDIRGEANDTLADFVNANVRAMQIFSKAASTPPQWHNLDFYAEAVLALGENLQISKLFDAGKAMKFCVDRRDAAMTEKAMRKTNAMLQDMIKPLAKDEKPS